MPSRCLPVLLLLLCLPLASMPAAADALDDLLAGLQRQPPASEAFQDIRYRRALSAPLVLAGELTWRGGMHFQRSVSSPYREVGTLEGGTLVVRRERGPERIVPLARAPELQALFGGLSALFTGDRDALDKLFTVELDGESPWRMRLVPRADAMRARVPVLELHGTQAAVRCLVLRQPGGDSLTVMGAAVEFARDASLDAQVEQHCLAP